MLFAPLVGSSSDRTMVPPLAQLHTTYDTIGLNSLSSATTTYLSAIRMLLARGEAERERTLVLTKKRDIGKGGHV